MAGLDNLKLNFCIQNQVGNEKVHSEIMEIFAKVLMTHKTRLNTVVCLFNPLFKCFLFCHFVGALTTFSLFPLPAFPAKK